MGQYANKIVFGWILKIKSNIDKKIKKRNK